jgi:hypothetical protein
MSRVRASIRWPFLISPLSKSVGSAIIFSEKQKLFLRKDVSLKTFFGFSYKRPIKKGLFSNVKASGKGVI